MKIAQPDDGSITPVRAVSMLLALGVVRLLKRQKDLDKSTRESVHGVVLIPGKTP
jgi:hypothetical protein